MLPLERLGSARLRLPEASGLAWDPRRRVLLAVGDDGGSVFEITLSPPVISRTIPLEEGDGHDLEGIALAADGNLLVASEKKRAILVYDREGRLIRKAKVAVVGEEKNAGIEGLAVDPDSGRMFALHERAPRLLLELDESFTVIARTRIHGLRDLASICARDGELWILSDESRAVARLVEEPEGWVQRGIWALDRDSAEGIELVDDRIYVVFDTDDGDDLAWYRTPGPRRGSLGSLLRDP